MAGVWLPLLIAGLMFGMSFFDIGSTDGADDEGDGTDDGGDETPQDGTLRLGLDARGDVTVPADVNRIDISAQTGSELLSPESPFWVNWNTDDFTPPWP